MLSSLYPQQHYHQQQPHPHPQQHQQHLHSLSSPPRHHSLPLESDDSSFTTAVADSPQLLSSHPQYHYNHSINTTLDNHHDLYLSSSPYSPPSFAALPLTPALSQQSQLPAYLHSASTPPPCPAVASPSYSSPAFSTQNSPSTDFDSSFWPADSCSSMQDNEYTALGGLPHTPPIKVFHSAPLFGGGDDAYDHQHDFAGASMLLQSGLAPEDCDYNNLLNPSKFAADSGRRASSTSQNHQLFTGINHKRASSGSSIVSLPSASSVPALDSSFSTVSSPATTVYRYPAASSSSPTRPVSTSQHIPVPGSFLAPPFSYSAGAGDVNNRKLEMAMRRALHEQQRQNQQQQQQQQQQPQQAPEEEQPFSYALAQSVSTVSHNSPATPQTSYPDEFDESSKSVAHGLSSQGMPKLNRTISDIYQDELYNPAAMATAPQEHRQQPQAHNPYSAMRNVMADRLHAAQQGHITARSQSPIPNITRQRSPFRHDSPYAQMPTAYSSAHLQQPQPPTSGLRGMELLSAGGAQQQEEPTTISPKDALLEYHEPEESSLFPPQPEPTAQFTVPPTTMNPSPAYAVPNFNSLGQFPSQFGQDNGQADPQYYLQAHAQRQIPRQPQQGYIRSPQAPQQTDRPLMHQNPEFTAPMPSMESTNSERNTGVTPMLQPQSPKRPMDTSSDTGTYSCTYHGCIQRFETPAKLQKHKREAHRQTTPGSSHVMARDALSLRNSQAGPHKCERINPSTGKPCNSIFSRPYDLTRHEDTIHNARKQKVRCHLCTEEKTFSRNDALTRHMRVVHPDVNWPGKQRRRGRD